MQDNNKNITQNIENVGVSPYREIVNTSAAYHIQHIISPAQLDLDSFSCFVNILWFLCFMLCDMLFHFHFLQCQKKNTHTAKNEELKPNHKLEEASFLHTTEDAFFPFGAKSTLYHSLSVFKSVLFLFDCQ